MTDAPTDTIEQSPPAALPFEFHTLTFKKGLADPLPAYAPICDNLWMGFNNSAQVSISMSRAGGHVFDIDPKDSDWMSIEIGLDEAALKTHGFATATLEASATTTLRVDAVLRVPSAKSHSGFVDSAPQRFLLSPAMRETPVFFHIEKKKRADIVSNDKFPRPVIILFLPVRSAVLGIETISAGPVSPEKTVVAPLD
jgi:hypothetical protein